ncbi:hypothetical protein [Streptomyces sp. NPDC058877]|uniref:hypothetical protein n=1 Tax=unclassified Streptomyces TaxID=2593676 RepID=UPI0036BDCD49
MESVEFGTTPAERLERVRGQLRSEPVVGTRAGQRTQPSPGSNLLLGVMLHAAARLEAGLELTDFEARMVAPLRLLLPEEEVRDFGRLYREESAARSTASVFPEVLTSRTLEQGYAAADLVKDLPALREEVLAQANINIVDLDKAEPGQESWDSAEFIAGQAAYGYGATFVTASQAPPADDPGVAASFIGRVDMYAFLCEDESNEWSASDEIYWGVSSAGAFGARQELLSRVFTNVDKGEWHNFDQNTTLYYGRVNTTLVCNISCWEEDDGGAEWQRQLRDKLRVISTELLKFVDVMEIYGFFAPQYGDFLDYVTITAIVARIVAWLIDLFRNDDDLIQERTLVFSQDALRKLVTEGGAGSTGWVFNGGDAEGRHRLQLKWIGNPPPADNPGDLKVLSPAGGQWGSITRLRGATDSEPALAVVGGNLHVAQRGMDDNTWVGRFNGTAWGGYTQVPNHVSRTTPALAEHGGKLYLATCGDEGNLYVTPYEGSSWGNAAKLPGRSSAAPALASRGGRLFCATRGRETDAGVYVSALNGTTWANFEMVPDFKTPHAPALAEHQGNLYLAAVGMDGKTYVTCHNGSTWSAATNLGGITDSSPALTVRGGVLYCAVRTLESEIALNSFNGTSWTGFGQRVPEAATMSGPALAGGSGDTLHIAYRSTN